MNHPRTGFSPLHTHSRICPVLLYLLMNHSVLCLCCHVNQCLPGLWPLQIRSKWRPCWQCRVPSFGRVLLLLLQLWGHSWFLHGSPWAKLILPGGSTLLRAIVLTSCLCPMAFVPRRSFCCELTVGHPFDNLSVSRSRLCVEQESCREEWQLRSLSEATGVHVDVPEPKAFLMLLTSLLSPNRTCAV